MLYSPDLNSVASCSGYVLDGEQRCYYNSYEVSSTTTYRYTRHACPTLLIST